MAAALLVAQAINFGLLLAERQQVSRARIEGPAISRFVSAAQRLSDLPPELADNIGGRSPRRTRLSIDPASLVPPGGRDPRIEERLRETAAASGLAVARVRAGLSEAVPPPRRPMDAERRAERARRLQTLILSAELADGRWLNARILVPRPDPWLIPRLAASTLLLYLVVLAAVVLVALRLARPLRDLTAAADRFRGRGDPPRVEPRGPSDVRRAIEAFNAMGMRVGAMLEEKDRMLGAIGHDLRTPLASLRIRAEAVEPEAERARMVSTIEEMAAMLEDTLALARAGRANEPARAVDLSALADAVVEEFRDLGRDVALEAGPREVARAHPGLLRRALRNLVENAVNYGGAARVSVLGAGEQVAIQVADRGPGIPEAELGNVQEPFYRLERSRSRATGGTGLGLALTRAAAQAHGGDLELENRPGGGLAARIVIPRA